MVLVEASANLDNEAFRDARPAPTRPTAAACPQTGRGNADVPGDLDNNDEWMRVLTGTYLDLDVTQKDVLLPFDLTGSELSAGPGPANRNQTHRRSPSLTHASRQAGSGFFRSTTRAQPTASRAFPRGGGRSRAGCLGPAVRRRRVHCAQQMAKQEALRALFSTMMFEFRINDRKYERVPMTIHEAVRGGWP